MQLEEDVWINLWHVLSETWTELGKQIQEEETHNSLECQRMSENVQPPRLAEVVYFPSCNISDSDRYANMPADPSPVDPKVEMLPQLHEEECSTLEPIFLW